MIKRFKDWVLFLADHIIPITFSIIFFTLIVFYNAIDEISRSIDIANIVGKRKLRNIFRRRDE